MNSVVVVAGPPGSGKSTLSTELAKRLGTVAINTDDIVSELSQTHPSLDIDEQFEMAELLAVTRAMEAASRGVVGVVDATIPDAHEWATIFEEVGQSSIELLAYSLQVPFEIAWDRVNSRRSLPGEHAILHDKEMLRKIFDRTQRGHYGAGDRLIRIDSTLPVDDLCTIVLSQLASSK